MEEDVNLTDGLRNDSEEPIHADNDIQIIPPTSPSPSDNEVSVEEDEVDTNSDDEVDVVVAVEESVQQVESDNEDSHQPVDIDSTEGPYHYSEGLNPILNQSQESSVTESESGEFVVSNDEQFIDDSDDEDDENLVEQPTEEPQEEQPMEPDIIRDFHDNIVKDNEYQARFKGAEWFENARSKVITCIGLGGIGSWASLLISRFNPRSMYLYDLDSIEGVNISGQFYKISQINQEKSFCTRDNISEFSDYKNAFSYVADATTVDFVKSDVFILGLDSMRARQGVMNRICYTNRELAKGSWIIEGRLSMRTLQVFCFKVGSPDCDVYQRKFMFKDEEADATVCSMKQTSFMANMIGSVISNVYMSICLQEVSRFPYGVPFMIEYDCLTYQFKTYLNGTAALIGTDRT